MELYLTHATLSGLQLTKWIGENTAYSGERFENDCVLGVESQSEADYIESDLSVNSNTETELIETLDGLSFEFVQ